MNDIFEYVSRIISYDADNGLFYWKVNQGKAKVGDIAGMVRGDGYLYIGYAGKRTTAQRLAWLLTTGEMPKGQIDHVNGIRSDNRICNLRDVSHAGNQHNRFGPQRNNSTGFLGVSKSRYGTFTAKIKLNGESIHIGTYSTPGEAYQAYLSVKRELHPTCTL